MKNMKKLIMISISIIMLIGTYSVYAETSDNNLIQDGTYIQIGKYNGDPILWRCISTKDDDENGKLIISDRMLCYKCFDSRRAGTDYKDTGLGFWEESNLRAWLNSREAGGNILWPGNNPPNDSNSVYNPYDKENGFLSSSNFSETELSAMKTVSQWQVLDIYQQDEVENGIYNFFDIDGSLDTRPDYRHCYGTISSLTHIEGGMKRIVDTMFILDDIQIYKLYTKYGVLSEPTEKALKTWNYGGNSIWAHSFNSYWLRTSNGPAKVNYVQDDNIRGYRSPTVGDLYGIRPAFYLNEDNVRIVSGSGEWNDPYIIDGNGQEGTTVFCQSKQLTDAQIIEENGEILVPVRDVFETFGADVQYYDVEDGIITATNDERTVVLQANNPDIGNGTDVFTLKVAPKIINGRAMISLEGVKDAYECKTEYVEELDRIVIDKPGPQDFGDGVGKERWQRARHLWDGYQGDID